MRHKIFVLLFLLLILPAHATPTLIVIGESEKDSLSDFTLSNPILWLSEDLGAHWEIPTITDFPENTADSSATFLSLSCTGKSPNTTCYAVGAYCSNNATPILAISDVQRPNAWSTNPIPPYLSPKKISCTGNNAATNTCAMITKNKHDHLFITLSHDGGKNWHEHKIGNILDVRDLENIDIPTHEGIRIHGFDDGDISCTGSGAATLCVSVGNYKAKNSNMKKPRLLVNQHQAIHWKEKSVEQLPEEGSFTKVNCAGDGKDAICAAIGFSDNGSIDDAPLLAVTRNGGKTWKQPEAVTHLTKQFLTGVSCVKNKTHNFCLISGGSLYAFFGDDAKPFFIRSTYENTDWVIHKPESLENYHGKIGDVSCTANSNTSFCAAVGLRDPISNEAVVITSLDEGRTWTTHALPGLELHHHQGNITCSSDEENVTCAIAGDDFIVTSTDFGEHWSMQKAISSESEISLSQVAII
jgi:hypothetical protein